MTDAKNKREAARKPATASTKGRPPAGAKKPADRKPPADTPKKQALGEDVTVEVRGESFTVSRDVMTDFELLEDIAELDAGNLSRLPAALRRSLGDGQYERAKEVIRDPETGRITIDGAAEFYRDLFGALNPS